QTGEVKGKILDSKTLEPLPFSNIFINNTTLGVAADQNGSYLLNNIPVGSNEIVFSFVGYQSYQKKIQIKSGETIQLDIRLLPDETVLETVVVSGTRDKEWDKQFKKFEKIFFGNTRFASSCKILNSWVLDFKESEANGKSLFTATASRPLEIENLALGYRIDYHLKNLASTSDGYSIIGEVRFEELKNTDPKLLKTRDQNRADAYYGSLRHLLRSIVAGQVKEEGFNLYTDKGENENNPYRTANFAAQLDKSIESFKTDNFVLPDKNGDDFAIQITKRLEVHYTRVRSAKVYNDISYPVSWLQVNGGVVKVNSKGIVLNPANLVVLGAMNDARVANLLPYNYSPEVSQNLPISMAGSPIQKKLTRLEEKVYLRTDKPYYYPGEKIWFKAYLNYRTPELMDSLSKVLYVELIDKNKKIVETKLLYIDGGAGAGSFDLADKLEPGNLYIRTYTHWMLNYEPETIFVKSIPLLGLYECPEVDLTSTPPEATTLELKFKSNKPSYKSREKIKLEFELKNQDGTPIPADLSVSVTDMQQVMGPVEEINILNGFLFFASQNGINLHEIKLPIESGISLSGQYKNKKGKPEKKTFAAVEGKFQNMKPIETDIIGNFWISGFQFYDSTEIIFQELGKKKKFEGTISLLERDVPSTEKLKKPVALRVVKSESPQRIKLHETPSEKTTLLKEVIINEEKPELNKDIIPKVYAKADITITGDEILESSRTSLVNAIRARVPGLNVAGGYLRIGSPSNFMGPASTEPLLIVDGLQFTGGGSDTNYSRLMQINPEMVDRVDVIKYGGAAIYGTRGGNGVIIVTTKGGEYGTINQTPTSLQPEFFKVFNVAGYSRPSEFVSPDHSRPVRDFVPDNRSTLFWSPQARTDDVFGIATVSFYAADLVTKYKIVVEGITDFGEPVRGVFYIETTN
ncbi:MAG: carboxypeptidase-like regulatory domain-containing protein, partial [Cyclobacteriaceae bacterium]